MPGIDCCAFMSRFFDILNGNQKTLSARSARPAGAQSLLHAKRTRAHGIGVKSCYFISCVIWTIGLEAGSNASR
jgi:hypothetical protein